MNSCHYECGVSSTGGSLYPVPQLYAKPAQVAKTPSVPTTMWLKSRRSSPPVDVPDCRTDCISFSLSWSSVSIAFASFPITMGTHSSVASESDRTLTKSPRCRAPSSSEGMALVGKEMIIAGGWCKHCDIVSRKFWMLMSADVRSEL